MVITLSTTHFLIGGVFLIVLAILIPCALQIKAMLGTLSSIQARLNACSKALDKTTHHVEAAEADLVRIREVLGLAESSRYSGAGISEHFAEFKSALALFRQHNFGQGK
ncbi:MAG TPA: hypothetical protein VJ969_00390 [Desulfopila sp.]|nr:hypothetical protein [Desulfopila sp.]